MSEDTMNSTDIHATARAQQDWCDGAAIDDNPFPPGSREARHWDEEMDKLMIEESIRELSAA